MFTATSDAGAASVIMTPADGRAVATIRVAMAPGNFS